MADQSKSLALIIEETGSGSLEEMQNMALIGHSLMAAIDAIQHEGSGWKDWAPADDPAEIVTDLFNALEEANATAFPADLSDDLREVLSTMLWTSGQIAECLRAGGEDIKRRAEDEQAHVLHWLISLALRHGPDWRKKASERIEACRAALSAAEA